MIIVDGINSVGKIPGDSPCYMNTLCRRRSEDLKTVCCVDALLRTFQWLKEPVSMDNEGSYVGIWAVYFSTQVSLLLYGLFD